HERAGQGPHALRQVRRALIRAAAGWPGLLSSTAEDPMNTETATPPAGAPPRSVHRFTIREYERLVKIGFLNPGDRAELIDGWLVDKMPHNPRHAAVVDIANGAIEAVLPGEWTTRSQLPIRLPGDNAPEP